MNAGNMEKLMKSIEKPRKFQMLVYLYLCVNMAIILMNHLAMVFYAPKTKHHCKVDNDTSIGRLVPIVTRNNERQWEGCRLYAGNNTNNTVPCGHGWTYYLEDGEATIISEFDLVCENAYKSDLASTMYFCGVMLGGPFFGYMADKYGRKPVLGFTLFASSVIGVAIFIFRNYISFVILRFCLGFFIQGLQNSGFVLIMELFSTKYRACAGIFSAIAANSGGLLYALLAYLVKDWKYIQLATASVPLIQFFLLCVVPESIRWHLLHGNFTEAEAVVKRTVTFNNLPFPRAVFDQIKNESTKQACSSTEQRKATIIDIFRSPALRKMSLMLSVMWFTGSASFYGLAFNISFLFGNKYLNFTIGALADVGVHFVLIWAIPRFGRRRLLAVVFFISAVTNIICAITTSMATESRAIKLLGTASALLGKACAVCSISLMFLFTSELYPTVVRNVSLGVNTFWSRIGGMAAPQIFFLGKNTSTSLPYAILGALTLTSGVLTTLLPETRKQALMDRLGHPGRRMTLSDSTELKEIASDMVIFETSL